MKFPRAEFFDILGILTFLFIGGVSFSALFLGWQISDLVLWIFLVIGILGLLIDGIIVYRTYLKKGG